jgi:acetyl esterase/lipase
MRERQAMMEQSEFGRRPGAIPGATQRSWVVLACVLALASACSPRRAAEALLLGDHFTLASGLSHGEGARQRLDVYRPRAVRRPAPVVVFLYGGRWQRGSREEYRLLGDALTRRGFVAVVPDYRLYPQASFPAWVEDGAAAVRWTRENIRRYGGDPERIFVVGHSAGAHTAALLALDQRYLRRAGVPAGGVRGFVSLAGPVDTVWTDPDVQALMGPRAGWPATYPETFIDGTEPPLLLLHGAGDETVSAANSVRLAARIRERGGCARSIVYPELGHIEIVVALAVPRLGIAPVLDDVAEFVRAPMETTCPPSRPAPPATS